MFVYKNKEKVYQESLSEGKLEMIQFLAEQETRFKEAKNAVKQLSELAGTTHLNDEVSVCLAVYTPEPTENTEIFDYENAGYQYDEAEDVCKLVWNKIPKELSVAKNNCIEKYHHEMTKKIREAEYSFGEKIVEVGDFILQSVRAQAEIDAGATKVDVRLKNGTKLEITTNQFQGAYNQVSSQYVVQCNERDQKKDAMEAAQSIADLGTLWNTYKADIG